MQVKICQYSIVSEGMRKVKAMVWRTANKAGAKQEADKTADKPGRELEPI